MLKRICLVVNHKPELTSNSLINILGNYDLNTTNFDVNRGITFNKKTQSTITFDSPFNANSITSTAQNKYVSNCYDYLNSSSCPDVLSVIRI